MCVYSRPSLAFVLKSRFICSRTNGCPICDYLSHPNLQERWKSIGEYNIFGGVWLTKSHEAIRRLLSTADIVKAKIMWCSARGMNAIRVDYTLFFFSSLSFDFALSSFSSLSASFARMCSYASRNLFRLCGATKLRNDTRSQRVPMLANVCSHHPKSNAVAVAALTI